MLRLRRSPPPDPAVVERVGRLLVRPGPVGGWVPPQEPEAASFPDAEVGDGHRGGSWSSAGPDDEPVPRDSEEQRSWSPRAADAGGSRTGLLPITLAGGRLDPGHRGAVALLLVCVLAAALAAGVVLRGRPQEVQVPQLEQAGTTLPGAPEASPAASPAPTELVVAVVGEVVAPGVVRLPPGSRVEDALRAAGGLAPGGSAGLLNLARQLTDGEQVVVGPDAAPDQPGGAGGGGAGTSGLVDLNRASTAELDGLPGIGPVLAERIVEWRSEHGGFASVDQLREVPGIGEAKYASVKSKVTV